MADAEPLGNSATRASSQGRTDRDLSLGQRFAMAVGGVFLAVGILGFVPGITQNLGDISFAGHDSEAQLLGLFQVSVLHNLVHLLFGVLGLVAARRRDLARTYLLAGGVVYLVLAVYGFATENESDANFVPVDQADDWLHVALGLGMIGLGLVAAKVERDRRALH
jgi:hypothetical protein